MIKITRRAWFKWLGAIPFVGALPSVRRKAEMDKLLTWEWSDQQRLHYRPVPGGAYKPGESFNISIPARYSD